MKESSNVGWIWEKEISPRKTYNTGVEAQGKGFETTVVKASQIFGYSEWGDEHREARLIRKCNIQSETSPNVLSVDTLGITPKLAAPSHSYPLAHSF